MIKNTWEIQKKNERIKMEIISVLMRIGTTKKLEMLRAMVEQIDRSEHLERPLNIIEIANMLETVDVKNVLHAMENADMEQLAARQMKEAFSCALNSREKEQ